MKIGNAVRKKDDLPVSPPEDFVENSEALDIDYFTRDGRFIE